MVDYPKGAFKSEEELLKFCEGREPFPIYIVNDNKYEYSIAKRILSPPWTYNGVLSDRKLADGSGGRLLSRINLAPSDSSDPHPQPRKAFLFHNYWDAFAYQCKLKEAMRQKETTG
jgi:hypothetical protein